MDVTPGYKQTEVGVIPEDWDVDCIGESYDVCDQLRLPINRTVRSRMVGPYPYYGPTSVQSWISEYRVEGEYALIGEDGDHFLKWQSQPMTLLVRGKFNVNNHAHIVQGAKNLTEWFHWYFVNRDLTAFLTRQGAGRYKLTKASLLKIPCALPSAHEQRAIAAALSDVDALLDGMTQLIAKKRDLKQAAMQRLLTGQNRLPGFYGEWEVRRLGEHVTFLKHGINSRAELTRGGPLKYLHYGDIHACDETSLTPHSLPSLPSQKATTLDRLADGDLILADASEDVAGVSKSVEIRDVGAFELVAGQHTIAARFDKAVLADGFKAYLQFCPPFASHLRRLAAGTKVYATNRAHIASVEMQLPAVDEQMAIARVFDDMGTEIRALEVRRDKTRLLKQAMMQELLTGRTRLV